MFIYRDEIIEQKDDMNKPSENEKALMILVSPTEKEIRRVVGDVLNCHPLVLEDCLHLNQRPKVDMYPDHSFIPFFGFGEEWKLVELGLIISKNYLLIISSESIPAIDELQSTLLRSPDKMNTTGRMIYEFLDLCTMQYFRYVDHMEEQMSHLERLIYKNPYAKVGHTIFETKRKLHNIRRIFSEERNVISTVMHADFPYTSENGTVYFIDVHDHVSRVVDAVDSFREGLTGLLELQMSMKGDRMNEIMKTLTVVSTFFLPISFIVGLYGVNLKGVPEYDWSFGYSYMWGLMIVVSGFLFWYIKRKKWL